MFITFHSGAAVHASGFRAWYSVPTDVPTESPDRYSLRLESVSVTEVPHTELKERMPFTFEPTPPPTHTPIAPCQSVAELTSTHGIVKYNLGTELYRANLLCRWWIKPAHSPSWIILHFTSFDLERGVVPRCPSPTQSIPHERTACCAIDPCVRVVRACSVLECPVIPYTHYSSWINECWLCAPLSHIFK